MDVCQGSTSQLTQRLTDLLNEAHASEDYVRLVCKYESLLAKVMESESKAK